MIHFQGIDSGATSWGQPDNQQSIFTPGEMIPPSLFAWIEERREFLSQRVNAGNFRCSGKVRDLLAQSLSHEDL